MTYKVSYLKPVEKIIKKWKKSNPKLSRKLEDILVELRTHPRTGIGHPEPLRGKFDITYSRHITAHDRIIYDIYDDVVTVLVIELEGHYNDK